MASADELRGLRAQLGAITRENTERLELIEKRSAEAGAKARQSTAELTRKAGEVLARLNERSRRAGQQPEPQRPAPPIAAAESDFGFEEDQEAMDRRAGYTAEEAVPAPVPASGRHRRAGAEPDEPEGTRGSTAGTLTDEDDYTNTDWLQA